MRTGQNRHVGASSAKYKIKQRWFFIEKVECLGGLKELIYSEIEKWNLKFEIEYPIDIEIMTVI